MQLEFLSGMALTFLNTNGTLGTGTLTSSNTYLTTANFTGSGNFSAVVVPSLSSANSCGSYPNPTIQLAVLMLSLDASVSSLCIETAANLRLPETPHQRLLAM